jgi:hypothetical protein
MKREAYSLVVALAVLLSASPASPSFAEDGRFGIRLWGAALPFTSGTAGSGADAPGYDHAFSTGLGVGAEVSWRLAPWLSLLSGIGYERYPGDRPQGISFDDLTVVPVYFGGKFHIAPDSRRWNPYLRVDLGAARMSSVDVSYMGFEGRYWHSSWTFLFDAGVGLEYRWRAWGASLEVKARYMGKPDAAMGWPSSADPSWTVPVVFGIGYYF